jgi:hypothetical protein
MNKPVYFYKRHRFPPAIIQYAVWLYHRFNLSYRDIEDLLAERGIEASYESVRLWCNKFGPLFSKRLKRRHLVNAVSAAIRSAFFQLCQIEVAVRGVVMRSPAQGSPAPSRNLAASTASSFRRSGIVLRICRRTWHRRLPSPAGFMALPYFVRLSAGSPHAETLDKDRGPAALTSTDPECSSAATRGAAPSV